MKGIKLQDWRKLWDIKAIIFILKYWNGFSFLQRLKQKGIESSRHGDMKAHWEQAVMVAASGLSICPCLLPRFHLQTYDPHPCHCILHWKYTLYLGEQIVHMELNILSCRDLLPLWKQLVWAQTNLLSGKYCDNVSNLYSVRWAKISVQYIDQFLNTIVYFSIRIFMVKKPQIMFIYEYDIVKLILKSFKETFIIFLAKSQKHFL